MSQDSTWAPMARLIEDAIARRAFPGAVVVVGRRDTILYQQAFGRLDYGRGAAVTPRTIWDVASLTKVVGLTTAVMIQVDERRVDLDMPVRGYVQMFGYTHDSTVTVRHLLTHSSGLPAWKPYWQRGRNREEVFDLAAHEPLEHPVHTRMVYSDVGAINLTAMVEILSGERLDRFLRRRVFNPLGMRDTRFLPPKSLLSRIAPTEMDTTYRHRMIRGVVHDENAFAMGGISGHAGLFSTGPDLAKFAQWALSCFPTPRTPHPAPAVHIVNCETLQMFTQRQEPEFSSRALGWDTPSENSSAGTKLSPRSFGHTGFTGTSIWIDPVQDLFVILLTNRVHPTRENTQIFQVRRAVADTAVELTGVL